MTTAREVGAALRRDRRLRWLTAAAAALIVASACTRAPEDSTPAATAEGSSRPDSIVLERTVCFGFCPAYRLSLSAAGDVRFERMAQRGTAGDTASGHIAPERLDSLLAQARAIGFFALPEDITPANQQACPLAATDHPSAIVTISVGDTVKRVNHYHGCHAEQGMNPGDAYPRLTAFEAAIDSAAGVARWLDPGRR